jgi:hypothetical protein
MSAAILCEFAAGQVVCGCALHIAAHEAGGRIVHMGPQPDLGQLERGERPVGEQPQRSSRHATAPGTCVHPVADLAGLAVMAQRDVAKALAGHGMADDGPDHICPVGQLATGTGGGLGARPGRDALPCPRWDLGEQVIGAAGRPPTWTGWSQATASR